MLMRGEGVKTRLLWLQQWPNEIPIADTRVMIVREEISGNCIMHSLWTWTNIIFFKNSSNSHTDPRRLYNYYDFSSIYLFLFPPPPVLVITIQGLGNNHRYIKQYFLKFKRSLETVETIIKTTNFRIWKTVRDCTYIFRWNDTESTEILVGGKTESPV